MVLGAISSDPQRGRIIISLASSHHCPGHSGELVRKRDSGDLGRPSCQQRCDPGPILGAVDLGIANDGECAGHEQAAQIAIPLFARAVAGAARQIKGLKANRFAMSFISGPDAPRIWGQCVLVIRSGEIADNARDGSTSAKLRRERRVRRCINIGNGRRMPIGLSIRRHARSRRPQGMNAAGQRAHMHRGRRRLAARTIDV